MNNTIEIKYKLKREFCRCCERDFDEIDVEETENTFEVDIDDFIYYSVGEDNEVFAEDMIDYVDNYLFEVLNDFIEYGSIARTDKNEEKKFLKKAYELMKSEGKIEIHQEQILIDYIGGL